MGARSQVGTAAGTVKVILLHMVLQAVLLGWYCRGAQTMGAPVKKSACCSSKGGDYPCHSIARSFEEVEPPPPLPPLPLTPPRPAPPRPVPPRPPRPTWNATLRGLRASPWTSSSSTRCTRWPPRSRWGGGLAGGPGAPILLYLSALHAMLRCTSCWMDVRMRLRCWLIGGREWV